MSRKRRGVGTLPVLLAGALAACSGAAGDRLHDGWLDPRTWTLGSPPRWQPIEETLAVPIHHLLADAGDPRFVYAACGRQAEDPELGGVLRSTDGGVTWLAAGRGLPPGTEVTRLAFAPAGFAGPEPALLAATRGGGIHASSTGGLTWRPLARGRPGELEGARVTALAALPGPRPAVAAGTAERGVLLSVDGGVSWQARNRGLGELAVAALAVDPEGRLVAATAAGVYRGEARGRRWAPLDDRLAGAAISALAIDGEGTLWAGSRRGELLALPAGAATFQPQRAPSIGGAEILTIVAQPGRVVVGTRGRGAVTGVLGGDFAGDDSGLGNLVVSAALAAADPAGEVILGTAGGLYRSLPPTAPKVGVEAGAAVAAALLALGLLFWRRSTRAAAGSLFRAISPLDLEKMRELLNHRMAQVDPERGKAILRRLAVLLSRSRSQLHRQLAPAIEATAALCGQLKDTGAGISGARRRSIAAVLDTWASALEALAGHDALRGAGAPSPRALAQRDRLFAVLLRAESLGHLSALRADAHEVERLAGRPAAAGFLDRELLRDLRRILIALEELSRVPSAEDRALYLGQALTQTLAAQERVAKRQARRPALDLKIGALALESVRQLLARSLDDIQQRAELVVQLDSKVLSTRREAMVVLSVRNVGQGHARNVVIELEPDARAFRAVQPRQEIKSLLRHQSARIELLVEPLVSDRVRLSFKITYDDHERSGQRREFADVVRFQQITARRAFRPLRPNPYVVGRPLMDSDVFIGRKDLFERIESNLEGANQDNVVVLMGQRRMGKTSILRRLDHHLGEAYVPVLIDLQGFLGSGEAAFFRELVATIHDELDEHGVAVEEPAAADFETDPAGAFRRRFLGRVRQALGDRRLLLAFDEFEVLQERIESGDLDPRILPFFRSLMQHQKNVSFMFAGTHRLDQLTGDYWSVLFNLAIYLDVGHLPPDAVSKLFTEPTAESFEIDPLALSKIYRVTGGHPHFSQLLARELVEFCNRHRLPYVTVQDVNRVAGKVAEKGQLHIGYLWNEGTRPERLLLLALKELLDRDGVATLRAAHGYLSERRVEAGDLQAAAHQLLRKEILSENAGKLSFRMELLRLWMDQRHDLETFAMSDASGWWRL